MTVLACLLAAVALMAQRLRSLSRTSASREALLDAVHEIRRPLAALALGLDSIARTGDRAAAAGLQSEVRRVAAAVSELQDAALDVGREISVVEVVEGVAAAWRPVAIAAGRDLIVTVDEAAREAAYRRPSLEFGRAVSNLISNAIEHGAGPVRVEVEHRGAAVALKVSNANPAAALRRPEAESALRGRGKRIVGRIVSDCGDEVSWHDAREHTATVVLAPVSP